MKELTQDNLRILQLAMLDKIDLLCKTHAINYSLCGGTLLGAIRNEGYIPWDDDIDIFLPRPDYEKLLSVFEEDELYTILEMRFQNDYYYPFAKLVDKRTTLTEKNMVNIANLGVYIDIFPVDALPLNKKLSNLHYMKLYFYNFMMTNAIPNWNCYSAFSVDVIIHKVIKLPFVLVSKLLGVRFWKEKLYNAFTRYEFGTTGKAGYILSAYKKKEIIDDIVFQTFTAKLFEKNEYRVIVQYSVYLNAIYGDFMKLPPKEKQVSHHNFDAYWKDEGNEGHN